MSGAKLVLLGTGGGPWPGTTRSGSSQAIVVDDDAYVVDCGAGVAQQLCRARLLHQVRDVYITHFHSDHSVDYFNVFLLGWLYLQQRDRPVNAYGPGPVSEGCAGHPADPSPGLAAVTEHHLLANSYDIAARMRGSGYRDLHELIAVNEIPLPPEGGVASPLDAAPPMEPILVKEDENVRVTAILVPHPPVFPSFAFRFDTEHGSIVVSGDTAPADNLVRLAQGADILVHEVLDAEYFKGIESLQGTALLHHLLTSHTPVDEVGKVAHAAGVRTLVLSHFVPNDSPRSDSSWTRDAAAGFEGEVVAGSDMLELHL